LAVRSQKIVSGLDNANYVITRVSHDGTVAGTFEIDQSASQVSVIPLAGQAAPTGSLETSGDSSTFLKTVTLNGAAGLCDVLTYHQGAVASVKG
jgi:hypothetical protein